MHARNRSAMKACALTRRAGKDRGAHMSRLVIAIDNYSAILDLMEEVLSTEGYTMRRGCMSHLNVHDIQCDHPDFVILEIDPFAPNNTIEFLGKLRACVATAPIPVIVESTDGRLLETLAEPLHQLGCITLEKPFDLNQFLAAIGKADHVHGFDWRMEPPVWLNS
jgi:DNA-binding NtrC family response regulator